MQASVVLVQIEAVLARFRSLQRQRGDHVEALADKAEVAAWSLPAPDAVFPPAPAHVGGIVAAGGAKQAAAVGGASDEVPGDGDQDSDGDDEPGSPGVVVNNPFNGSLY